MKIWCIKARQHPMLQLCLTSPAFFPFPKAAIPLAAATHAVQCDSSAHTEGTVRASVHPSPLSPGTTWHVCKFKAWIANLTHCGRSAMLLIGISSAVAVCGTASIASRIQGCFHNILYLMTIRMRVTRSCTHVQCHMRVHISIPVMHIDHAHAGPSPHVGLVKLAAMLHASERMRHLAPHAMQ
jgi:hypothetical protein